MSRCATKCSGQLDGTYLAKSTTSHAHIQHAGGIMWPVGSTTGRPLSPSLPPRDASGASRRRLMPGSGPFEFTLPIAIPDGQPAEFGPLRFVEFKEDARLPLCGPSRRTVATCALDFGRSAVRNRRRSALPHGEFRTRELPNLAISSMSYGARGDGRKAEDVPSSLNSEMQQAEFGRLSIRYCRIGSGDSKGPIRHQAASRRATGVPRGE